MSKDILNKIKSKGYWRIHFVPIVTSKDKISTVAQCRDILKKAVVMLRGWDYPHLPESNSGHGVLYNGPDYIASYIDWGFSKEFWRMHQSEQFIHFFGMLEDWYGEDSFFIERKDVPSGETFDMIQAIYRITEIYEFLRRLVEQGVYKEGVSLSIELFGVNGRRIVLNSPNRIRLSEQYVARIDEIPFKKEYTAKVISERSQDITLEAIEYIFTRFNWDTLPTMVIKSDIRNLLERKT